MVPIDRYDVLVCHCDHSAVAALSSCLTLSNIMTLKSGLEVTKGHWKWHDLTDSILVPIVFHCTMAVSSTVLHKAIHLSKTPIFI